MKNKIIINGILAAALIAVSSTVHAVEPSQAELLAQAKISKEMAQQTALAKVPNGTVKDGELEKENGKLQWSFDLTIPDSKNIKEVAIDAITGDVIAVDTETPADQAKEAAADAAEAKQSHAKSDKQAKLLAQANLSKFTAQTLALAEVPHGVVKGGELEIEHGKLLWSFDLTIPNSKNITLPSHRGVIRV